MLPIALFIPEHVMQVMWVRGPSMTPYLNEEYEQTHTKSDMVMVNMWPWGSILPFKKERKLERGMIVTFRWVECFALLCFYFDFEFYILFF